MPHPEALKVTTPSEREVRMTRVFHAPRGLVFDAGTKPELLKRWLGWPSSTLVICEIDLRVGGGYRFVWSSPYRPDRCTRGVYREVDPPARVVRTEIEDDGEVESLLSAAFAEEQGYTTLTSTKLFPSREMRDAALELGLERGARESLDRLAKVLASIV